MIARRVDKCVVKDWSGRIAVCIRELKWHRPHDNITVSVGILDNGWVTRSVYDDNRSSARIDGKGTMTCIVAFVRFSNSIQERVSGSIRAHVIVLIKALDIGSTIPEGQTRSMGICRHGELQPTAVADEGFNLGHVVQNVLVKRCALTALSHNQIVQR
ncbi:hypothetical protein BMS3Bbin04_02125 [bacterium BMS3Bbin04]|nr:hypothetical protein BMS3Bbin04_02125 [bacterium BMS3Bbin04]